MSMQSCTGYYTTRITNADIPSTHATTSHVIQGPQADHTHQDQPNGNPPEQSSNGYLIINQTPQALPLNNSINANMSCSINDSAATPTHCVRDSKQTHQALQHTISTTGANELSRFTQYGHRSVDIQQGPLQSQVLAPNISDTLLLVQETTKKAN